MAWLLNNETRHSSVRSWDKTVVAALDNVGNQIKKPQQSKFEAMVIVLFDFKGMSFPFTRLNTCSNHDYCAQVQNWGGLMDEAVIYLK